MASSARSRRRAWVARRGVVLALLPALALGLGACRQLLGIDDDPPIVEADAGTEGGGGGAVSPFTVVHGVPEGETLFGIWGTGPDFFVTVGTSRVSHFYRNGLFTRVGGNEKGRDYLAVWGFSDTDIYAVGQVVGGGGFVDHFDGNGWTGVFDAPTPLLGVWGTVYDGTSAVIAVGVEGDAYGWNTNTMIWQQITHLAPGPSDPLEPGEPRLWGISGRNIDDFAIAAESRIYHLEPDAGGLAYYEPIDEPGTFFRSIWQSPQPLTSIYFGSNFFGLWWFSAKGTEETGYPVTVLSRDEAAPNAANSYILGVWGTDEKVVAVGDQGRIYVYDTGLASVTRIPSPTDEPLGGVWGSSVDDVWIVGRRELILHGFVR